MRRREAELLGQLLSRFPSERLDPCLNLGSSGRSFREQEQPHLQRFLFDPLERRGVRVLHVDRRQEEGVDLVGDLNDADFRWRLRQLRAGLVLCNNVLEHVPDPAGLAALCSSLLAPGGLLCVSVPRRYPYHPDPIDNGLRPDPADLRRLFPDLRLLEAGVIADGTLRDSLARQGTSLWRYGFRLGLRLAMPFYHPRGWLHHLHRSLWLFREFEVTWALFEAAPERRAAGRPPSAERADTCQVLIPTV